MVEMSLAKNLIVFGHLSGMVGVIYFDTTQDFVEDKMIQVT